MIQTTPTRDEAVLTRADVCRLWQWAAVNKPSSMTVEGFTALLLNEIDTRIASAPAPASGGVDAVRRTGAEMIAHHRFRLADDGNCAEIDSGGLAEEIDAALASLSPAATPVSEAGGETDMRRVCEALGFDPTNHHNAAKCPYCTPTLAKPASSPAGGDAAKVLASMAGGKPEDYAGMIKPDIFPSADEAARILRDRDACRSNLGDAWAAMQMIREAVETLGPIGAMPAEEHLAGPTFLHEAEAIVAGIMKMKADQ